MLGFKLSYNNSSVYEPIYFLLKCFSWLGTWFQVQGLFLFTYLPNLNVQILKLDPLVSQLFFGGLVICGLLIMIETFIFSLFGKSVSRSGRES
jgi:hypothetical protein